MPQQSSTSYAVTARVLQSKQTKGKSASKVGATTKELQYLKNFSASITQCMAKAMTGHLSDFAFVSMANVTLQSSELYHPSPSNLREGLSSPPLTVFILTG